MGPTSADRRNVLTDRLLDVAEFSHAHWFFGNLYELLAKVPHRVAASEPSQDLPRSPFGAGSPGRYYAPIAPINAPAALGALAAGWQDTGSRKWLIAGAAGSVTGAAATVYVLRALNPRLFFGPEPLSEDQREPLLRQWYRIHAVRLAASAIALAAVHRARTIRLKSR